MHRISNGSQAASLPTPAAVTGTPGYATAGNPSTGTPPTTIDFDAFNAQQEELMAILTAAGIAQDKTLQNQVIASLNLLFAKVSGSIAQAFAAASLTVSSGVVGTGSFLALLSDHYTASLNTAENAYVQHYAAAGNSGNLNSVPNMSQFSLVEGNTGYQMLPSGLMLQWFSITVGLQSQGTYNFPFAFPTNAMFATGNVGYAIAPSANWETVGVQASNRTQYTLTLSANVSSGTGTVFIIALGY